MLIEVSVRVVPDKRLPNLGEEANIRACREDSTMFDDAVQAGRDSKVVAANLCMIQMTDGKFCSDLMIDVDHEKAMLRPMYNLCKAVRDVWSPTPDTEKRKKE